MAVALRELGPDEHGKYIPLRELLEPEASEAQLAVSHHVAGLIREGVKSAKGELLVEFNDGSQAAASYNIQITPGQPT